MNELETLQLVLDHHVLDVDVGWFVYCLPDRLRHISRPEHLVSGLQELPGLPQAELSHHSGLLLVCQAGLETLGVHKPRQNIHQTNP